MPDEPSPHVSLENQRPRFRGLGRSGWTAIWAMALLFGLGPVALRWTPLGARYDDAERKAIDTQFARLLGELPPAPEVQHPEIQRLADLDALANTMQLGAAAHIHTSMPSVWGHAGHGSLPIHALGPSAMGSTVDLDLAREALLTWHQGAATTGTDARVISAPQLELLAAQLAMHHGGDHLVRQALLHLGRVLREGSGDCFAHAGWAITAHALTPIRGESLPPELEADLPAPEDLDLHLLRLALAMDTDLERAIESPRSAMAERERFLERPSDFSERGSSELLDQRTELRQLAANLSLALRDSSPPHDPGQLLLRIEQLSTSRDVDGRAGVLFT